jgi:hypothetical protein
MRGSVEWPCLGPAAFASIASLWATFWAIAPALVHQQAERRMIGHVVTICSLGFRKRRRRRIVEVAQYKEFTRFFTFLSQGNPFNPTTPSHFAILVRVDQNL